MITPDFTGAVHRFAHPASHSTAVRITVAGNFFIAGDCRLDRMRIDDWDGRLTIPHELGLAAPDSAARSQSTAAGRPRESEPDAPSLRRRRPGCCWRGDPLG